MKFPRLFATDLFCYERLDLSLADRGLVLVEGENRDLGGSNGSGKSSVFKALTWILFGKAPQGRDTVSGDDVIREDEDHEPITGNTRGFVEVDRGDLRVQVFRHRRHQEHANKVLLYADGKDVTKGSDAETQKLINEYLGVDYDAWVHTVLFPQDATGFADLTDSKQKTVIDKIMRTERFDRARKRAKEQRDQLATSIAKLEGALAGMRQQCESEQQKADQLRRQEAAWEDQNQRQIATLEQQLSANLAPAWTVEQAAELEGIRRQQTMLPQLDTSKIQQQLVDVKAEIRSLEAVEKPEWSGEVPQGTEQSVQQEVSRAEQNLTEIRVQQQSLLRQCQSKEQALAQRDATTVCPTCEHALGESAKDRMFGTLRSDLEQIEEQYQDWGKQRPGWENCLVEARDRLTNVQAYAAYLEKYKNWERAEPALSDLRHRESVLEGQLESAADAERSRDRLRTLQDGEQVFARWQQEQDRVQKQIQHLSSAASPYADLRAQAQATVTQLLRQIVRQEELLEKLKYREAQYKIWYEGFGPQGVRSLLLDHVAPELNGYAAEYLEVLSSGMAKMRFVTTKTLKSGEARDNFHAEVSYKYGGGGYKKISGGERRRPDLAAMFALGDLAASKSRYPIGLRLLDEPFDGLDGLGAEQVVQVLQTKLVDRVGTVLVMTHDDTLKQLIGNRIQVVKENGVSWIIE